MQDEKDFEQEEVSLNEVENDNDVIETKAKQGSSGYVVPDINDESVKRQLSGMFQNWFLDYSSYVILNRAVPYLYDGLKPVQRRVLHSMREKEDGRYNKVANIVGHTMQYHPHGDSSIYESLVQLGQKDLLIDCQGNWGNILTGDGAAAGRYIEARLTKFALEVVFNPKTTEWKLSYDGRNNEPVALPIKFPLLLVQGAYGIAVGLQTRILPHNFNEIADACIAYLKGEEFTLYPDFPTAGFVDVSNYKDGKTGSKVKIRAKISKIDNKTLCITDIPFGVTTDKLIDSIITANDKGKIQIKKVDDNTAENVEILVHLSPGRSSDKTIDALYACTDCEVSISPNCCVIQDEKPHFFAVSDVLRFSTDNTLNLLKQELLIKKVELQEAIFSLSLEKIFIEERIYKDKGFENSKDMDEAVAHIDKRLEPFKPNLIREIERDDILKLMEIKMGRILKFSSDKADDTILNYNAQLEEVINNINNILQFTIDWFEYIKKKYGGKYQRKTEIRMFDTIEVTKVVEANEKLYINKTDGFIGTALKKDEFVCNCSDIDDVIVFFKDGRFKIVKVADKIYVGKNILYLNVFKRNDTHTIYNVVYRNGLDGISYMKRFAVNGVTRDKEYNITQGTPNTRVTYFSVNFNGEAEVIRVVLRPKARIKNLVIEQDFSEIAIKGRGSRGNILTKNPVDRITLKTRGGSTLGGRKVWFDADVKRLNYEGRGQLLGEFLSDNRILVICKNGLWYTSNFDASNHYPDNILRIEKFDAKKVWTAALYNAEQKYPYLKRFMFEDIAKENTFLGDNNSTLYFLTDVYYARLEVVFGGADSEKEALVIDADEFIGVKSFKAKGARLTTFEVAEIKELEPIKFLEPVQDAVEIDQDDNADNEGDASAEQTVNVSANANNVIDNSEQVEGDPKFNEDTGESTLFNF